MPETDLIWMSLVIFIPTIFAIGLLFFPRGSEEAMRWWALFGTALTLGASLAMFLGFKADTIDMLGVEYNQDTREKASLAYRTREADTAPVGAVSTSKAWIARKHWMHRFNIHYFLGADGISVPLILLTTVLSFLALIASWNIDKFVRGYLILFLILETGMLGTFLALDFFLFYIFWEVMLLP